LLGETIHDVAVEVVASITGPWSANGPAAGAGPSGAAESGAAESAAAQSEVGPPAAGEQRQEGSG
jgi:hypothetical protein